MEKRKNFAEALAYKADPSSERLMNTVLTDFRNEVLAPIFDKFKNDKLTDIEKTNMSYYGTLRLRYNELQHSSTSDISTLIKEVSIYLKERSG